MPDTLPEEVKNIFTVFQNKGFQIYAVGGCVRDMLLGKVVKDWDFTTNATPENILSLFKDGFYDNRYGTVGIPFKNPSGEVISVYEVTTFRSEAEYSDNRHPDKVVWGESLEEDLKRRDFTMNALAYDGNTITDLFNGKDDIRCKIIRAVGNPDTRFQEDALRMMRAVRLACQLTFSIEEATMSAIKRNAGLMHQISGERIRDELMKILSSDFPADGVRLLRSSGIMAEILPELEKTFGVEQKSPKRHHKYDVGTHLLLSLENCPSADPVTRFATLLHDIGKAVTYRKTPEGVITFYNHEIIGASIARNIADRLHFSKKDREKLLTLVRWHQFSVNEHQTDSAIRRIIKNIGVENLDEMLALRIGDRLGGGARETSWRLELFKKRLIEVQKKPFSVSDLKVNGYDVMSVYNTGPGPLIGAVLNMLFNDVVEGKIKNEREELIKRLTDLKTNNQLP